MIELWEVTKRYGRRGTGTAALRGVTLTIPRGAVWAVVGPNGAGKSTLLSLMLGFIRPSSGEIAIAGDAPRDYLRERGAGYLPERFNVPSGWRAGESLRMLARLDRASADDVTRAIELLGLVSFLDVRASDLSRGMLQRLGIAQALVARRELVVLDEPTEGLDPIWRVRLRDVVAGLKAEGCTVIVASHDLGEVERMADRAVVLEDGTVRDVLDVRSQGESAEYRIRLATPFAGMSAAFPDIVSVDDLEHIVAVAGAQELSQRLGALIALGAIVSAVEPMRADLEERVRDVLDGES